jgi:hypothetical protein
MDKAAILSKQDLRQETLSVPEWGCDVTVREMTGRERELYEQGLLTGDGDNRKVDVGRLRARLVAFTVVNGDGRRLFDEADIDALAEKAGRPLKRIADVASRLNGIGEAEVAEEKKP